MRWAITNVVLDGCQKVLEKELVASFYEAGTQKLSVRLEKCIQVYDDYVIK